MEEDNNIQNFSAADIERYHKGLMPVKEMHALEKAAMDDSFLADALDGYSITGVSAAADISDLQNRLAERTGEGRMMTMNVKSGFKWMRVAAMFIVVAGAGLLAYALLNKNKYENELADKTDIKQVNGNAEQRVAGNTDSLIKTNASDLHLDTLNFNFSGKVSSAYKTDSSKLYYLNIDTALAGNISGLTVTGTADTTKTANAAFANPSGNFSTEVTAVPAAPNAAASNTFKDNYAGIKEKAQGEVAVDDAKKKASATEESNKVAVNTRRIAGDKGDLNDFYAKQNQKSKGVANYEYKNITGAFDTTNYRGLNVFRGQVTDAYNNGVAFANVTVGAVNVGTYADANGNFNLVAPDSVLTVQLRAIGYNNSQVTLRNSQAGNQVVLQEDRSMPVTVLGEKMPNVSRSRSAQMTLTEPEPDDGWEKYDSYLVNNLQVPELKKDEIEKKGKQVELSFDVNSKGEPVNIKVTKSLCKECDEEAVRLVKEGPKWKKKNKKGKAKVTIVF